MNFIEMKQAAVLLGNEWNLGKNESKSDGNICAWIYLFEILAVSEEIITYKEKNKLIGFCGYSKRNSNKFLLRKKFYNIIKKLLFKNKNIKNKEALRQYYNNYDYLPEYLENEYDGEISILIVDKNYREKGIGKELLSKIFEKAKKNNLRKLYILSDESCSYKFYEKCGCIKVYETNVYNKEKGKLEKVLIEKAFVYERNLEEAV